MRTAFIETLCELAAKDARVMLLTADLGWSVLERFADAFPDRFPLSPALSALAAGDDPVIVEEAPWTREQVVDEVLEAVADEIHRLLDEGVVPEAADVDTGLLLGAGWPFFLGGITPYLDSEGISERVLGRPLAELSTSPASI